jgi:hypothetical protein
MARGAADSVLSPHCSSGVCSLQPQHQSPFPPRSLHAPWSALRAPHPPCCTNATTRLFLHTNAPEEQDGRGILCLGPLCDLRRDICSIQFTAPQTHHVSARMGRRRLGYPLPAQVRLKKPSFCFSSLMRTPHRNPVFKVIFLYPQVSSRRSFLSSCYFLLACIPFWRAQIASEPTSGAAPRAVTAVSAHARNRAGNEY